MIAKIDLEKAYDRMDLNFLRQVLTSVSFSKGLIEIILFCISSAQISVLWNEKPLPLFTTSKGLVQVNPCHLICLYCALRCLGSEFICRLIQGNGKLFQRVEADQ